MKETRAWKKMCGLGKITNSSYVGSTEKQCTTSCLSEKLVGTENVKRHKNTLKMLVVKWTIENGLLLEDTNGFTTNWERGKVIKKDGKKLFWDWKNPVRIGCITLIPDLKLGDTSKKTILLLNMTFPKKQNGVAKLDEKVGKYRPLCFESRKRL